MLLDLVPDLAHHLATRQRPGPDHRRQLRRRLQRLLQCVGLLASAGVLVRPGLAACGFGFGGHGLPPNHLVQPGWWMSWPGRSRPRPASRTAPAAADDAGSTGTFACSPVSATGPAGPRAEGWVDALVAPLGWHRWQLWRCR